MYRFSPSPTGKLHFGSIRTAVVSYILSKQRKESFILRIEDTDKVRSSDKWTEDIIKTLKLLGIQYKTPVIKQSSNKKRYQHVVKALIKEGYAYYCNCSVDELKAMKRRQIMTKSRIGYEGTCRYKNNTSGVIRLNTEKIQRFTKKLHFKDGVFGSKTADYRELPDAVLMRANGEATYLLANTVDDYDSGVTNIVRGADLLPQSFYQLSLLTYMNRTFGTKKTFNYTHLPLMLDEQGEKISKRKDSTKSILSYIKEGALPDAIIQFVLSTGNTSISTDIALTLDDMIEQYDITKTSVKNTKYLEHKLWYINKLHLKRISETELNKIINTLYDIYLPTGLIRLLKVRYKNVADIAINGKKIIDMYLQFAEDKHYLPSSLDEIKEYRSKVFNGEDTPPINELLPVLHSELILTERSDYV